MKKENDYPRIGCDIDGVNADFNTSMRDLLKTISGKEPPRWPPQEWHWMKAYCASKEIDQAWREIDGSEGAWWRTLAPIGGAEAVKALDNFSLKLHADVYFLTARFGAGVKNATEIWLMENMGQEAPTVLIGLDPEAKAEVVNALDLNIIIDDRPENLEEIYEQCGVFRSGNKDRRLFLFDQPWNQDLKDFSLGFRQRVERVSSLAEVVETCGR